MPESPQVSGRVNTTILPGITLSGFDIRMCEAAEAEFVNSYRAGVVKFITTNGVTLKVAEMYIDSSERLIAENHFKYDGSAFNAMAWRQLTTPTLIFIAASKATPVDKAKAAELYEKHPDRDALHTELLYLMGYPVKNAGAGKSPPSTGTQAVASSLSPGQAPGSPSPSTSEPTAIASKTLPV